MGREITLPGAMRETAKQEVRRRIGAESAPTPVVLVAGSLRTEPNPTPTDDATELIAAHDANASAHADLFADTLQRIDGYTGTLTVVTGVDFINQTVTTATLTITDGQITAIA